jgi:hypothetical protein
VPVYLFLAMSKLVGSWIVPVRPGATLDLGSPSALHSLDRKGTKAARGHEAMCVEVSGGLKVVRVFLLNGHSVSESPAGECVATGALQLQGGFACLVSEWRGVPKEMLVAASMTVDDGLYEVRVLIADLERPRDASDVARSPRNIWQAIVGASYLLIVIALCSCFRAIEGRDESAAVWWLATLVLATALVAAASPLAKRFYMLNCMEDGDVRVLLRRRPLRLR